MTPDVGHTRHQALVELYREFTPQEADRLAYELNFAEARDNLNARLVDNHRTERAAALVAETIAAYRQYARLPGADVLRTGRDLAALATRMANANRPTEAAAAQQAADELRAGNPALRP
ncbi:hypothetical protein ABZS83_31920 [Streptomyces sp. NPDC005426]|uniref:hypothetical protein n=1 Tax=Streptomyces sp. NPDC005426 TaxID=3155344 RepID=UPI0033BE6184